MPSPILRLSSAESLTKALGKAYGAFVDGDSGSVWYAGCLEVEDIDAADAPGESTAQPATCFEEDEEDVEWFTESRGEIDDVSPWLKAAEEFCMNTDFDLEDDEDWTTEEFSLQNIMEKMKEESGGKRTIQVLGDKILLSKLLANLDMPQMPVLFETYSKVDNEEVETFVDSLQEASKQGDLNAFDIVLKPTHLSNGTGALILNRKIWEIEKYDAEKLTAHMEKFLAQRASDSESEALRSLVPGFIAQPRYSSCLDFGHPLELRVVTLWGRARLGVWWWGRVDAQTGKPQRSSWIVRCPKVPGEIRDDDAWKAIHRHDSKNEAFEQALSLFTEAMPAMAAAAEAIATATGAPFLRSDFFVGSSQWGVRLNEVAYGSGLDYSSQALDGSIVDDAPKIARILQEGHQLCQKRRERPANFLGPLGAWGFWYDPPANPGQWWQFWRKEGDQEVPGLAVTGKNDDDVRIEDWVVEDFAAAATTAARTTVKTLAECQTPRTPGMEKYASGLSGMLAGSPISSPSHSFLAPGFFSASPSQAPAMRLTQMNVQL